MSMLVTDCKMIHNTDFRMYYYYDKELKGYVITDLPNQPSNSINWVNSLRNVMVELLSEHPIYFLTKDIGWIKNHLKECKTDSGVIVYQYVNHFNK